jgi:hypothetical protein
MSTTKLVTGKVRLSYVNIFEPSSISEDQEKKYNVSIIIPKSDKVGVEKAKAAIAAALKAGEVKFGGKIPAVYKNPLRDGDAERPDDPAYAASFFINANSFKKPAVVDADINPVLDKEEVYSGCYGRVVVNFYAFNVSGNKGVAAGLNSVQKLADGDRLGGDVSNPADDFGDDLM